MEGKYPLQPGPKKMAIKLVQSRLYFTLDKMIECSWNSLKDSSMSLPTLSEATLHSLDTNFLNQYQSRKLQKRWNHFNIWMLSFAFTTQVQPLKFIHSEKATKFCKISTLNLSYVVTVKSTVEISQNFVAFSEYMNFKSLEQLGFDSFKVPTSLIWICTVVKTTDCTTEYRWCM